MADSFEEEYAGRFDWRRERQVDNLRQLAKLPGSGGDPMSPPFFRYFGHFMLARTVEDAFRKSIYMLFPEASQTYVLGFFQASLLVSGAVLERVLKLEYMAAHGALPSGNWTLGRCIHNLTWTDTRIDQEHLDAIDRVKGPRNSRAHALLEHDAPEEASMGGANRGVETLSSGHYMLEPFRGDAHTALETLYSVLADLYGSRDPALDKQPGI